MNNEQLDYKSRATERRLLHILFTHPGFLPPVVRAAALQAREGWNVVILGAEVPGTPETVLPGWLNARVILIRGLRWPLTLRFVTFCLLGLCRVILERPQCLYLSDPLSTPVGVFGILWPRISVVYHEHDAPRPPGRSPDSWLLAACRRIVAGWADTCIVPSHGRLDLLPASRRPDQRRIVVNNMPLRCETRVHEGERGEAVNVLFMGTINPVRLPLSVVAALATVPEVRLRIVGYETVGSRGYTRTLLQQAQVLGVEDRIFVCGFLPRLEELPEVIRRSDVGLSLLPCESTDINHRTMVGASNKPYQFLACEVPLLVPKSRVWEEEFVQRGVARSCLPEQADSLAREFRWFAENRDTAREMGRRGRALILEKWNYETQFQPLLKELLGQSSASGRRRDTRVLTNNEDGSR